MVFVELQGSRKPLSCVKTQIVAPAARSSEFGFRLSLALAEGAQRGVQEEREQAKGEGRDRVLRQHVVGVAQQREHR